MEGGEGAPSVGPGFPSLCASGNEDLQGVQGVCRDLRLVFG